MANKNNPLVQIGELKQAVWFDYIRRDLVHQGGLKKLIDEDGLKGVTSNPAIFEKAISSSADYLPDVTRLAKQEKCDSLEIYERLAVQDIQSAADVLRGVYESTSGRDGYVSLEVSPYLAHDQKGTIEEARRLWRAVNRPNCMIKVPATQECIPAIEQLISEGININVTLLFAVEAYEAVAHAYIDGIERLVRSGGDPSRVASVASFFVSRVDSKVDPKLAEVEKTSNDPKLRAAAGAAAGKIAIANAKIAYELYERLYSEARWKGLQHEGACTQRLLWASTGTKNPKYSDVIYVDELIGPETVNTMPPQTLEAARDHSKPQVRIRDGVAESKAIVQSLSQLGISMKQVTDELLDEGVKLFVDAFDQLLGSVEKKRRELCGLKIGSQSFSGSDELKGMMTTASKEWKAKGKARMLWNKKAALWTDRDEAQWLGWLGTTEERGISLQSLDEIRRYALSEKIEHVLLMGMGGSSLCPEVLKMTFGKIKGYPELHVLDSTDPQQVNTFAGKIDFEKTLFIVASKSGSTLEPNIFKEYFYTRAREVLGSKVGSRFIAITDPGSKMQQVAQKDQFKAVFPGLPNIGGRYSALSNFGLVPAALMGVDVKSYLARADEMWRACRPGSAVDDNPGVQLGLWLGLAWRLGRDKVTLVSSAGLSDLGAWLEQLLAESLGKQGKGLIPVDRENLARPDRYGKDRVFVYTRLANEPDGATEDALAALEKAGHPVARIIINEKLDLGQEFFRWEIATAVAGAILEVHPFDQPDVEASKVVTRELTSQYEKTGTLAQGQPITEGKGMRFYTDCKNQQTLEKTVKNPTARDLMAAHLARIQPGDYVALLAYIEMCGPFEEEIQKIRHLIRDRWNVATCVGFGPRFLHSTGQDYKGGPNTGVFLQITADDDKDLQVPGQKYTFGLVKAAQAQGDFHVLAERGRRALRVHLGADVHEGLKQLRLMIEDVSGH